MVLPLIAAGIAAGGQVLGSALAARAQGRAAGQANQTQRDMYWSTRRDNANMYENGVRDVRAGFGDALGAINAGYGQGQNALADYYRLGRDDLSRFYGRGREDMATGYSDAVSALNPYDNYGVAATNRMAALSGVNGGAAQTQALAQDPGYQFRMQQGTQALDRSAASRGRLFSGAQGKALTQFGQGLASEELNNAFNRTALMQNQGQQAAGALSSLYANRGNALSGLNTALGTGLSNMSANQGANLSNLGVGRGTALGNLYQNRGTTLGNLSQNQATQNQALNTTTSNALANTTVAGGNARAAGWENAASGVNQGIGNALYAYMMQQRPQNPYPGSGMSPDGVMLRGSTGMLGGRT